MPCVVLLRVSRSLFRCVNQVTLLRDYYDPQNYVRMSGFT